MILLRWPGLSQIKQFFIPVTLSGAGTLLGFLLFLVPVQWMPVALFVEIRFLLVTSTLMATVFLLGIDQRLAYVDEITKSQYRSYMNLLWVLQFPSALVALITEQEFYALISLSLSLAHLSYLINLTRIGGNYLKYALTLQIFIKIVWLFGFLIGFLFDSSILFILTLLAGYLLLSFFHGIKIKPGFLTLPIISIIRNAGLLSCLLPIIIIFFERFIYLIAFSAHLNGLISVSILNGIDLGGLAGSVVFMLSQVISRFIESQQPKGGAVLGTYFSFVRVANDYERQVFLIRLLQVLFLVAFAIVIKVMIDWGNLETVDLNSLIFSGALSSIWAICLSGAPNLIAMRFSIRLYMVVVIVLLFALTFYINTSDIIGFYLASFLYTGVSIIFYLLSRRKLNYRPRFSDVVIIALFIIMSVIFFPF